MPDKFGKNKNDDPKRAGDKASDMFNDNLMDIFTKSFLGKDFVKKANAGTIEANQALDAQALADKLAKNGADASAEVESIQDTGYTINTNPVVVLGLKVKPAKGEVFQTTGNVMVSRLSVPRIGDQIKIKYNKKDPAQFIIV